MGDSMEEYDRKRPAARKCDGLDGDRTGHCYASPPRTNAIPVYCNSQRKWRAGYIHGYRATGKIVLLRIIDSGAHSRITAEFSPGHTQRDAGSIASCKEPDLFRRWFQCQQSFCDSRLFCLRDRALDQDRHVAGRVHHRISQFSRHWL